MDHDYVLKEIQRELVDEKRYDVVASIIASDSGMESDNSNKYNNIDNLSREDMEEYCIENCNDLKLTERQKIYDMIYQEVGTQFCTNANGSHIHIDKLSKNLLINIYIYISECKNNVNKK